MTLRIAAAIRCCSLLAIVPCLPGLASAATLTVGVGKQYAKPCAAIAAAKAGDLIEVDAGTYNGDTCAWSTDNLTIRGVGGRASIDLKGVTPAQKKGIFTIAAPSATIENFELSGAAIAVNDGNNGAGIRHQGLDLTVRNCFFHDNQNGILGSPSAGGQGTVLIESSEFSHNGAGDGFSHNMYLGNYASFTLRHSYSHGAVVGHLVKSRGMKNFILYNRITGEPGSSPSYELDLPNGGSSFVIGNLIEQATTTQNPSIIAYAEEGLPGGYDSHLYVVNNTLLNNKGSGTFINDTAMTPAVVTNNIFWNGGTLCSQGNAVLAGNFESKAMGDPKFTDVAKFDVHLLAGSPCIDKGVDPGMGGGMSLSPTLHYVHPLASEARGVAGAGTDVGAYEFGMVQSADMAMGGAADLASVMVDLASVTVDLASPARDDLSAQPGRADAEVVGLETTVPVGNGCACDVSARRGSSGSPVPVIVALALMALLFRAMRHNAWLVLLLILAGNVPMARAQAPAATGSGAGSGPGSGLIPRDILFGNPERASPKISPDGKRLAWLAPDKAGVLQVWMRTIGAKDDKVLTADKRRGIRRYEWAEDDRTLLYLQDADGDENWHVFGVELASGVVRDFTPWQGIQANIVDVSPDFPNRVVVSANVRDRRVFDAYRIDLRTGATEVDTQNPGDIADWTTDPRQEVRAGDVVLPDGGHEVRVRDQAGGPWRTLLKTSADEELGVVDFSAYGKSLFLLSSVGSDTTRLVERNLDGGGDKEIARMDGVDVQSVFVHPRRHVVQAVAFARGRVEWRVIDSSVQGDFAGIAKLSPGDYSITSRDRADEHWVVGFSQDRGPVRFYSWDRKAKKGTFLFVHQPKLEGQPLAEMKFVTLKARDGLDLPAYLTTPKGVEPKNLPSVLLVHGGPWARDSWGYNGQVQWLANRGYAVLQINFRGSTGFGKKYLHAGDKQWGRNAHNDLIDGVQWLIKEGIADPKRVAIMGGSYGGYAALAGAAFTPDTFRCAVDIVGPSNLFTLLKSIPPYWAPILGMFTSRMGDPEKDKELLRAASPLFSADKIRIPMLIAQGANDPRVNQAESEQIVAAIEKNGGQAVYVLYPDEGHGFARPENRIDFYARAEQFLAAQLGGKAEPLAGDKIPGSTAVVRVVGHASSPPAAAPAAR